MEYYFTRGALRDLKKLPKQVQERIIKKLDFYVDMKDPFVFGETLKDASLGSFRYRIGEYRVIFDVDTKRKAFIILAIGHRREIYR